MKSPHIFVNPQLIAKIENKVNELMVEWQIDKNERHTIYQMVATIESGIETKVFYHKNGIVCDGWNGYRHFLADMTDPNPRSAFAGFYRTDKNQWVGWSIYLISKVAKDGSEEKIFDQVSMCNISYGLYLVWENKTCVWGFYSYQDYYTEDDQLKAAHELKAKKHVKRITCEPISDMSGMYRLKVETTCRKSGLKNEWRQRIAA